jgi:hypothetical protein
MANVGDPQLHNAAVRPIGYGSIYFGIRTDSQPPGTLQPWPTRHRWKVEQP